MKITHEFTVAASIERAWAMLTDLEEVAPCLPGATLTGRDGETFTGKIKVKVGPVTSEFAGTAGFAEKDDAAHRAVIDAKGKDVRGAGNATALITAQLSTAGDHTVVTVDTDLTISGKLAQFGSGMIEQVSAKLLAQFVDCLEAKLAAGEVEPTSTAPEATAAPTAAPTADPSGLRRPPPAQEQEPLDLMALAGGTVLTRLLPVVAVVVGVVVLVVLLTR